MTEVRIELPLPLDISGTLIQIIGMTYPGTVIKDGKGRFQAENVLCLDIPDSDRHKSPKKEAKYEKAKQHLNANVDSLLTELGPSGISMGLPEYMLKLLVEMARGMWAAYPDAENYLETTISDRESGARYVAIVARSEGQTPHALRRKAEAELAEANAEIERLTNLLRQMGVVD